MIYINLTDCLFCHEMRKIKANNPTTTLHPVETKNSIPKLCTLVKMKASAKYRNNRPDNIDTAPAAIRSPLLVLISAETINI